MSALYKISHINPKTICDIGANVGSWTRDARHLWPEARIVMIEANPKCEPMLQEVGVTYHIAALGKEPGKGTFFMQPGADTGTGNSFYRENTPFFDEPDRMILGIKTLDEILPGETYDLIKIDTQGSEVDILMGGRDILSRAQHVLLEVSILPYNEGAPLKDFVDGFMRESGFPNQYELEDITHPLPPNDIIQKNVLYSR